MADEGDSVNGDECPAPPDDKLPTTATSSSSAAAAAPPLLLQHRLRTAGRQSLPKSTNVSKDSLMTISRASGIFVLYLTACANDVAREGRRTTIVAKDVLGALRELDFGDFLPAMEAFLEGHRRDEQGGGWGGGGGGGSADNKIKDATTGKFVGKRKRTTESMEDIGAGNDAATNSTTKDGGDAESIGGEDVDEVDDDDGGGDEEDENDENDEDDDGSSSSKKSKTMMISSIDGE
ncbi:hypothetical protein ACHAXA_006346 [Cyclostephanos tholiformis]|uniref:Transcription factor CBF/NF-Y/archaeal histone domain-containing protein n=1 Tax=Cyclostephanos tholiformis TaxID=382380 RepID=A0ABD3RI82_9STRA